MPSHFDKIYLFKTFKIFSYKLSISKNTYNRVNRRTALVLVGTVSFI